LDRFDSILILADAVAIDNGANMELCDSRSLACLLIVQETQRRLYQARCGNMIFSGKGSSNNALASMDHLCNPVSEILDTRTRGLLQVAGCKGYIMSNQIISAVVSQVAEEKDINVVLRELLSAEGCETYLKDLTEYFDTRKGDQMDMSFWDVALLLRKTREVLVGYKPEKQTFEESNQKHLLLNPPNKSEKRLWSEGDILVVIAFD